MKITKWFMLALIAMFISACEVNVQGGDSNKTSIPVTGDNVSIIFVVDNSGSMAENGGGSASKLSVANDSLVGVGQSIDQYLKSGRDKTVGIGFVRFFNGDVTYMGFTCLSNGAASYVASVARKFDSADGGTPLGKAILTADGVLASVKGTYKKHIVVLTDGVSNQGIGPVNALKKLTSTTSSNVYFIALNTASGAFKEVSKTSTVLEANNATQLNQAFDKLLVEKILLEKED